MKQLADYLLQFHPLDQDSLDLLLNGLASKSFRKGQVILRPGDVQKELYFVTSGAQMSYFETEEKTHVVAFTYAPGICAVPDSFSFQAPSSCFISCLSDSSMLCLPYQRLQELFEQSRQIERLFRRMTEIVLAGVIRRHIDLQALTMEERYRTFCKRSPHLLQLVPHKHIASYLGIDATNFSKMFNSIKI